MTDADALLRAYATLTALKNNPIEGAAFRVSIETLNKAIDQAASGTGLDLDQFKIDDAEMLRTPNFKDPFVPSEFYGAKLNAVLNYLKLLLPEEKARRIGF